MIKNKLILFFALIMLCGCQSQPTQVENQTSSAKDETKEQTDSSSANDNQKGGPEMKKLAIVINNKEFQVDLYENETTDSLLNQLPLTIQMDELNSNEKFHYLDFSLPTQTESIGNIKAGDLMLYGDNCLVLFYKRFSTSYQYTKIGHINDVNGLIDTIGRGSVEVTLQIKN